jgi:uncharacterized sulfatase
LYAAHVWRSILNILKSRKAGVVDKTKKYIFAEGRASSSPGTTGLSRPAIRSREYSLSEHQADLWTGGDPSVIEVL